jgi:hypothetical protein
MKQFPVEMTTGCILIQILNTDVAEERNLKSPYWPGDKFE